MAEVAKHAGFAAPVATRAAQGQRVLEVTGGLLESAPCGLGRTKHGQGCRFGTAITGLCGCPAGMVVGCGSIVETGDVRVAEDGGGKADGMAGPAVGGAVPGDCDEVGP